MTQSRNFQIFFMVTIFLLAVVMLVMNDVMSVWNGAEANWLNLGSNAESHHLLAKLVGQMSDLYFPFFHRLPSTLLILAGLAGFYGMAWRIFGKEASLLTVLFAAATFMVPTLGKLATLDPWLFCFQLWMVVSLLRFLKEPTLLWRIVFSATVLIALWLEPLGTLILILSFSVWLLLRHPQWKNVLKLQPWLVLVGGLLIGYFLRIIAWKQSGLLLGFFQMSYAKYLLLSALAVLPILGFCVGGLRDLLLKFRKGEELSTILIIWIVGAILAESTILQIGLCLLAAKQVQAWPNPKYPFHSWVKTAAILQMLLAFCLGFLLMTRGFMEFGPVGFRAGLVVTVSYWTLSLVGVIGLYAGRRNLMISGPVLSGLIGALFFWVWVYPLIESKRLPFQVLTAVEKTDPNQGKSVYFLPKVAEFPLSLEAQMQQVKRDFHWLKGEEALGLTKNEIVPTGIYVMPVDKIGQFFDSGQERTDTIKIWSDSWQLEEWAIVAHTQ